MQTFIHRMGKQQGPTVQELYSISKINCNKKEYETLYICVHIYVCVYVSI